MSLFSPDMQIINDAMLHLSSAASERCESFNVSFGMHKNRRGEITYTAMVVAIDRNGKKLPPLFVTVNKKQPRVVLETIESFIQTI